MSNTEVQFPVGEYVNCAGQRLRIMATDGVYRWCKFYDVGGAFTMTAEECSRKYKPYVAPVVKETSLWIGLSPSEMPEAAYNSKYGGVQVKLTFEDGKLVKAEVEK